MIHPLAVVHPDADIHPQAFIGPWCMVEANVRIGADCELMSHVVVKSGTTMGEKNKIYPFVVLGAQPQDLKYQGEPTELVIGSSNVIRENVTMNLGTVQGGNVTRVGDHCLIMAYSHLGHDCQVGNSCILSNYAGLAGHVVLEDYVTLGGMVGIAQFVKIGKYAYIGAQSGLERDIPPFVIAVGCRPTLIKGANIVGLRRRGMTTESIQILNEAIKLWTRADVLKETSLNEIHAQYGEVLLVKDFIDFIRKSNGVIR